MNEDGIGNYEVFRDCLSAAVINKSKTKSVRQPRQSTKGRKNAKSPQATLNDGGSSMPRDEADDPAELADFIDYLATEIFASLPIEVRTLTYRATQADASFTKKYTEPLPSTTIEGLVNTIPATVTDTLTAYSLLKPPTSDLQSFITPILSAYISAVTPPPPPWISTRTTACEICDRDWVPLTYHHLIPRGVHAKVLKRGWHEEHMLNSVAWLCRACHSFVHGMAGNEELAREWYTVEKICERDDVWRWATWVGGVRWKKR